MSFFISSWIFIADRRTPNEENIEAVDKGCGRDKGCGDDDAYYDSAGRLAENLQIPEISVIGNLYAPVTIVEFSDFLCPYCKTASELLKKVLSGFEGKVRLVFVNYPLDIQCNRHIKTRMHEGACLLARGAVCASRQNRFSDYQEAAFAMDLKNPGTPEMRLLGIHSRLDLPVFMDCLTRPETSGELNKQIEAAHTQEITSIPAIFINGKRVREWKDQALLTRLVGNEIKKGKSRTR